MKISDVGEFGLIDIVKRMGKKPEKIVGIGDDCAVIPINGQKEIVVTTDTLVENVHFLKGAEPFLLGRKSLAVNISDTAAMAASPKWAFLSLSLNPDMEIDYIESFISGFYSMAGEFGVELLGGDTTKSSIFTITVTLIGENPLNESLKRNTANFGDDIYVTGKIGCSYAGLRAIKKGTDGYHSIKQKHLNPTPRVKEALVVREFASAMIDISDGLLQDCSHICEESGVAMELNFDMIPFCDTDFVDEVEMLSGGEDYELIFSAENKYENILKNIENVTKIGKVKKGNGVYVVKNGNKLNIRHKGFTHF